MAKRPRVHSRDLQPQLATPKGLLAAARVQRFDWPLQLPTTTIDELGRKLHVGTTQETPTVKITMEAFDTSHNTVAMLAGYTPATFPVSGVSITDFKNVDVIGQIRDASTQNIVNALYVKRGVVTSLDASFGVKANSTVTYSIDANSKKEFKQPVKYQAFSNVTLTSGNYVGTLSATPTFLTRTSGYIIDAFRTGSDGSNGYLDEGTDFSVSGSNVTFTTLSAGDTVWVTYCTNNTTTKFQALDDAAPAAIQGKYVPLTISVSNIPRVQSATIRAALPLEEIHEMGSGGTPVSNEVGIPKVTGDISVLKTDNDLLALLEGVATSTVENDMAYAQNTLPLKIELRDPTNPSRVVLTYYVPSITITQESDTNQVNQSMNETFSWESTTGELIIASGSGVY